jgi:hypothetical protein
MIATILIPHVHVCILLAREEKRREEKRREEIICNLASDLTGRKT